VQVWPLPVPELPGWISRRARSAGLKVDEHAAKLLAERVEGNLLAAAQEVHKLGLLYPHGEIDAETVALAVADGARYGVYDLADAAVSGDAVRSVRILAGLCGEGIRPELVLWALAREVRGLVAISERLQRGESVDKATQTVWKKRKSMVTKALRRYRLLEWRRLLQRCAHVDRVIKGEAEGRPWDELLQLTVGVCGHPLFIAPGPAA
jgi:DNA polymerase-3 subunit delta